VLGLGVTYALLPLDRPLEAQGLVLLLVALVLFCAILALQVRSILRSTVPMLRAIEVLASVIPLFLLTFAAAYVAMAHATPGAFSQRLPRPDAVYFAVTVFATVGFGDIVPVTGAARMLVTAQMIGDLVILGVVLKLVVGAAQLSRRRLAAGDPSAAGAVSTTGPGSQDLPSSQDPPQQPAGVERHVGH
jgi:amino acid transporter